MSLKPYILTIAGFDPSCGAGLTADIKTIENLNCYGVSACTANTVQNDISFTACHWIPFAQIKAQIEILYQRFTISVVKIGIVENWKVLYEIVDLLLAKDPGLKIIVDPVLTSSSAYAFHDNSEGHSYFNKVLDKIYLLTPNYSEINALYPDKDLKATITYISSKTNLLVKGGHREIKKGMDQLFQKNHGTYNLYGDNSKEISEKHGSGCVLSAAIASFVAEGYPLIQSCYKGKMYVEDFLASNSTLLGDHLTYKN